MIVLEPIATSQLITVTQRLTDLGTIPRANKLQITDEETNVSRVITLTATAPYDYFDNITLTINFEDVRDYSVNDGKYIENTTTNQFILND